MGGEHLSGGELKTGQVIEPSDGTDPHLETIGWSPWLYHMYEEEFERYWTTANAVMMKLERMPPAVRGKLKRIDIRCPVKGCLLATVYQVPYRPTAGQIEYHRNYARRGADGKPAYPLAPFHYFYVGRTTSGTEVYDILNFAADGTWKDDVRGCSCCRILYWRSGCRHGTASIDREAIYTMFSLADRMVHIGSTEEEEVQGLPDCQKPLWGKRVFHPEPAAWHAKKRAPRR